ncbi:O-antigen ligase family protein [Deinococcus lacus]|uniref:O-antigen ligase family protein n=1 Tax=Deinococcus lacus TaxID=392561 RepID=A0ABW1YEQ3_9DEIO
MSAWNRLFGLYGPLLALFYFAGIFKTQLDLPIDLTVLLAAALSLLIVRRIAKNPLFPRAVAWAGVLWGCMALGFLAADEGYGTQKAISFFSLTLLGAVAPALLLRDADGVRRFANSLLLIGLIVAASAANSLGSLGVYDRLTVFDANTIALARAVGAGLTALTALWLLRRFPAWAALPLMAAMAFIMIASGSRGPLAGVVFAALPVMLYSLRHLRGVARLALLIAAAVSASAVALPFLPEQSRARIETFLGGELDKSASIRAEALQYSWAVIQEHPWGIGMGNFQYAVALSPTPVPILYPHNILAEVALESGWLPSTVLVFLFVTAVLRCIRNYGRLPDVSRLVLSLLLFSTVNALVSGDLNDNRLFWGLLFLALSLDSVRTQLSAGQAAAPLASRSLLRSATDEPLAVYTAASGPAQTLLAGRPWCSDRDRCRIGSWRCARQRRWRGRK